MKTKWYKFHLFILTLHMLGNFSCFCCSLMIFFLKINYSKKLFQEHHQCQMVQHVGADLGPICLQRISEDDISHH